MHFVIALNFFLLGVIKINDCSDEALVLSMGDVMRAIFFSPVKGTCVWESACLCERVRSVSVIVDVPFDQSGR